MKLPIHIRRSPSGDAVQAYCPNLPGCSASAPTEAAALDLVRRRLVEHLVADKDKAPRGTRVVTIEV